MNLEFLLKEKLKDYERRFENQQIVNSNTKKGLESIKEDIVNLQVRVFDLEHPNKSKKSKK